MMGHKFVIVRGAGDNNFRVQFKYNSEIMVWSENYTGKSSTKNCIDAVKTYMPDAPVLDVGGESPSLVYRFEIVQSKGGEYFTRFRMSNGEILVRSQTYTSKASVKNLINVLQDRVADAPVEDDT